MGKSDSQVEVYGQIDELNAWIGLLAAESGIPDVCRFLTDIQRDLFKIGGFYSFDFSEGKPYPYHFMEEASVERLEKEIDRMQAGDLINRISYDIDTVNASLSTDLVQVLSSIYTVVGSLYFMFVISKPLILVFVITVPISSTAASWVNMRRRLDGYSLFLSPYLW